MFSIYSLGLGFGIKYFSNQSKRQECEKVIAELKQQCDTCGNKDGLESREKDDALGL